MGMQWIYSEWLTPPDRSNSGPFYPWPEDWLGRNSAGEPLSWDQSWDFVAFRCGNGRGRVCYFPMVRGTRGDS